MLSLLKHFRWFIVGGLVLSSLVCSVHAGIASTINLDLQAIPPGTLLLPPAAKKAPAILVAGMGGAGGNGASGVGATSKPAGQAGMLTRKNGITTHQLSFVTLNDKGDEREEENDPPPTEKAQPESAVPISCQRCQNTLNEQEVSRILRGSTAEPVFCDACLHSVAQAPQGIGKRKATRKAARKRARPAQAEDGHVQPQQKIPRLSDKGPEEGRPTWDYTIQTQATREAPSEKRTGKRKQVRHPQSEPSAKKVKLKTAADSAEALEILKQSLSFEMNEQENRAARQLFETLKRTNIRIKQTLYKLLARVDRKELPTFCAKASVFFDSLTATIKDTGCLTSMLKNKKHLQDFAKRKDSELKYLAGLDTLRALSSMNSGKGLPDEGKVKAMLDWTVWKVDGQFSMDLFRAVSSMNSSRGLPDEAKVKAMLDWPVWKVDGQFNMELFRALSSMTHGKGLPDEAKVKTMLDWPVWKVDGQFSMELFRALSSMNSSRGLPDEGKVKAMLDWPVWKVDGQFNMELFRALSSMTHGKGLPDEAKVKAMLDWPVWKVDGQFSMELFRALSSMTHGKGLPDEAKVKAMLDWPVWKVDGQFSMELFRALSSMNNGKGLPDEAKVKAMLDWLNCGKFNDVLQSLMIRLYASEGMPDTKTLKQYKQKVSQLFFPNAINELESDDKEEQSCLIKQVALFLSTRKPQYFLSFETIEHFYQQVTGDGNGRLEKLLRLLTSYGGAGVIRYLALRGDDRKVLLSTCSSRISLPLAMKVINGFSPQERKQYLFFNRNLETPPDKAQWNNILLQLESLASILKTPYAQRLYLEAVWGLSSSDRETFLDETRAAAVLKVFPSLNALKNLANKHSRQWLKELFEACLQYGQGAPSRENIKRLFTALLEAQLPLAGHGNIPNHFLSGHMSLGDSAILIPVISPVQTSEELALHFMAAVMGVLSDMFYDYEARTLKIEQYGGERHTFPAPELKIHDDGLEISNWTDEVFNHFLAVTEFPEHYYFSEEAWQQHCTPEVLGYLQRRTVAFHQRERAAPDAHTFQPLSIPALMGLLKSNIHINAAAWKSFDHHKDRLPMAAHSRLLSEMEKATHEGIPVSLRDYLEAGRPGAQNEMSVAVVGPPAMEVELPSKEKRFQSLWADLSRKERVIVADLELLAGYKEYMTMETIVSILKRIDAGIEPYSIHEFRQLLRQKRDQHLRHDPLLLNLSAEILDYFIEAEI